MTNRNLHGQLIGVVLAVLLLTGCGAQGATPVAEAPASAEEPVTEDPRTGDIAPDFSLPDHNGNTVSLAEELQENQMVVLVFYHGHT